MNNVVKLAFSINFIKWLALITIITIFIPFPSFVKTLILTSSLTFISFIILLLRLPPFMFSGIVKYQSVRFFYDLIFSIGVVTTSLFSGSAIFIFSAIITGLIFSAFLESYKDEIGNLQ